jgi:hypothetical protein
MPQPEAAIAYEREGMAVMDEPVTEGKAVMDREPVTKRKPMMHRGESMVGREPAVDAGARWQGAA